MDTRFTGMKKMMRKMVCMAAAVLIGTVMYAGDASVSHAASDNRESYTNSDTGYQVIIEDDADLLTASEREQLAEVMGEITLYGNVAFKSIDDNYTSTASFAETYYHQTFDTESGVVFVIDMDNRNIWIFSDGAVYRTVTKSYANTVTDNVYRYASNEEYYECAAKAFEQIGALLRGQKIAQPMKYIGNLLLAASLALLINFGIVISVTRIRRPGQDELLSTVQKTFNCTRPTATFVNKTKTYSPQSSSSGGSSGGGGGGGSSSGGGGGHSF